MAERKGPTEREREEAYQAFFAEEVGKPLKYVRHDVDAHRDGKLEDLRDLHGFEAMGRWWLLVELMAGRKDHRYDMRRAKAWERLARDLEYDGEDAVERCREFVGWLYDLSLIHRESFDESGYVRSERIERNACELADEVAKRRMAVWVRDRQRAS